MKHISEEYGSHCNYLKLTGEELSQLEPFLKELGVRCRITTIDFSNGERNIVIQAENPYHTWIDPRSRHTADMMMTDEAIKRYKY